MNPNFQNDANGPSSKAKSNTHENNSAAAAAQ